MDSCDIYWQSSDWLSVLYLLERWCPQQNRSCFEAKLQALLSACERGEVRYRRSDGNDFDDPVQELWRRNLLLIEGASFETWVIALEGNNPLTPIPTPPNLELAVSSPERPAWADEPWPFPTRPDAVRDPGPDTSTAAAPAPEPAPAPLRTPAAMTGVDADAIIAAFPIELDDASNRHWWKSRMSDATRYKLDACRLRVGGPNRGDQRQPSLWLPEAVAGWLVDKNHLPANLVARLLLQHFPEATIDPDWLSPPAR